VEPWPARYLRDRCGWLPLFFTTLFSKSDTLRDLLTDYAVNVRMLIDVPLLLAGQIVMEGTFRMIARQTREAGLLPASEQAKLHSTISNLVRLSDSIIAEIVIVVVAYIHLAAVIGSRMEIAPPWALGEAGAHFSLSPQAGISRW
jgi:hypothetical protein